MGSCYSAPESVSVVCVLLLLQLIRSFKMSLFLHGQKYKKFCHFKHTLCIAIISISIIILTATTAKHGTTGSESMYLSQRMLILTFGRTSIYVHCFKYFDSGINTILIGCRKYQNVHSVFFQLTLLLQCHQFEVDSTVMEHRHHSWR